ncbi:MAG: carboxypeptidase-like regulatory domain-containing protein, partial [Bacteroidales bacterium]|nr:carboxypeptidase-like regulatory domain-containing protein [Bacteroidales bacterium]
MKTHKFKIGITLCLIGIFISCSLISTAGTNFFLKQKKELENKDTSFIAIKGKIVDKETNSPLIFANVYLTGTNIATVSNSDGNFILKIPSEKKNSKIEFSFIGYKNKSIAIDRLNKKQNLVRLEVSSFTLSKIPIRPEYPLHPEVLLKRAVAKISENYSVKPNLLTGFYRETIKKNRHYVAVSEGVIEIYKTPYNRLSSSSIKLLRGRKSKDVKRMDTINFKIQGGPYSTLTIDLVKNPEILFPQNFTNNFNYRFLNIVKVNERDNYVIAFEQIPFDDRIVYSGKIYLDIETLAFSAIEFNLNPVYANRATSLMVKRKPLFMRVSLQSANYYVNYKENNGKWYLNYARGEVVFNCKWKKKLFRSKYTTMSELAVTNRSDNSASKFSREETLSSKSVFVEKVSYFKPDSYWGDYNYIKPNESIESAVRKLNRKFKKN